jgi:Holliday junction resolvase
MELGPSRFLFERLVSEVFKLEGNSVQTDVVLSSKGVSDAVDVVDKKGEKLLLVECKYRKKQP